MPTPLTKAVSGRPSFFITHNALFDAKPELVLNVMGVINIWSHCEAEFADLLSSFLNSEFRKAYAMLHALGSSAQRQVIDAVAKMTLSEADLALYREVETAIKPSRTTRNAFAHGLWGSLPTLDGALLLVDPEDLQRAHVYAKEFGEHPTDGYLAGLDYSKVMVYTS